MPDYDPKSIPILDDVIKADILEQADAEDKHKAPLADITDMEDDLSVDHGTINIFSTAPVELSPEDAIIEDSAADASLINDLDTGDSAPSIGALDSLGDAVHDTTPYNTNNVGSYSHHARADTEDSETEHFEEEAYESALIDYQSDADVVQESNAQPIPEPRPETQLADDDKQAETEEATDSVIEQSPAPLEAQATQATQATQETQAIQATMTLAVDDIVDDVVNDIVSQLIPDLQQQLRYLVQQALEDRLPAEIISQHKTSTNQDDT